jgi:4-hydroxymandelate oxidase
MMQLRRPPLDELLNLLEFEDVAKTVLPAATFASIAGSDRTQFDRITMHARLLVPMLDLDLTATLFGDAHYTPILVGPVSDQRRFHADAELATIRGASAAQTTMIAASGSSVPIAELAREAKTPLWFAVYADDANAARTQVDRALAAGCKVLVISTSSGRPDWKAVAQIRKGLSAPVVVKGVSTLDDANRAAAEGVQGIVVASLDLLPRIVDAVGAKLTVLADSNYRRGADVLKALALGARGVLVARPVMWALAGYGAEGVRVALELLQSDLARHMGALGAENLAALNRNFLRVHRQ